MYSWLNGVGAVFRQPLEGSTNYLSAYDKSGRLIRENGGREADAEGAKDGSKEASGDGAKDQKHGEARDENKMPPEDLEDLQPFPLNSLFRSQPVLSLELRDEIYRRVVQQGQTVRQVSQDLFVDMKRVGAVVRLKTVEQEWTKQGKKLQLPYQQAILEMLPTTPLTRPPRRHESINDLPVHNATLPQLFYPTSESRHFTRKDAAHIFNRSLLTADDRIPHPDMITWHREFKSGRVGRGELMRRKKEGFEREVKVRKEAAEREQRRIEKRTKVVDNRRWHFKFEDIKVESAGADGRGEKGVGWRYGMPLEDRKKGQVKIPTKVDA